jgi:hypothetical protein
VHIVVGGLLYEVGDAASIDEEALDESVVDPRIEGLRTCSPDLNDGASA